MKCQSVLLLVRLVKLKWQPSFVKARRDLAVCFLCLFLTLIVAVALRSLAWRRRLQYYNECHNSEHAASTAATPLVSHRRTLLPTPDELASRRFSVNVRFSKLLSPPVKWNIRKERD